MINSSKAPSSSPQRRQWFHRCHPSIVLTLLALIITGCGSGLRPNSSETGTPVPSIAYSDLPQHIGRGYPVTEVEDVNFTAASIQSGTPAPDFAVIFEDGRALRLSDLHGRPVMLNFWATWCGPCRAEMPEIVRQASEDDNLVVIAVNVQEAPDAVRAFAEEFDMNMLIARDEEGKLRDLYQIRGMPTSIFIDQTGSVSSTWPGLLSADKLDQELNRIR